MNGKRVDGFQLTVLTEGMPRPKKPDSEAMRFLGFKVPPAYVDYLPTIVDEQNEDFPATVARKIFLRGYAAYLDDKKLWKPEERKILSTFLKQQQEAAREIDVESTDTYNDASRRNHG